ncbi:MAG: DUF6069 family protein [Candidatus Promineifilaceae bacterium]
MTYDIRNGTLLAIVLSLVLNLIVFFVGQLGLNVPFTVDSPLSPVSILPIVIATLVTIIGAGIVLWALQNSMGNFVRIFLWLAAIIGLLSLIPVYLLTFDKASFFSLGLMHVFTASAAVYGLLYFSQCDDCEEA